MGFEWLKPGIVLGSILYAFIGVAVLWLSFVIIDKITPYKLWEEIVEKKNLALAIVVGAMFVPIANIFADAIHGLRWAGAHG
jgi:uncharacterized membrane protein YjfL (UPF0719 family)